VRIYEFSFDEGTEGGDEDEIKTRKEDEDELRTKKEDGKRISNGTLFGRCRRRLLTLKKTLQLSPFLPSRFPTRRGRGRKTRIPTFTSTLLSACRNSGVISGIRSASPVFGLSGCVVRWEYEQASPVLPIAFQLPFACAPVLCTDLMKAK
jgi:hypothetical protein